MGEQEYRPLKMSRLWSCCKEFDSKKLADVPSLVQYITKCFGAAPGQVVAYFDHEVRIGRWMNSDFSFFQGEVENVELLLAIRVFNATSELYMWRQEPGVFAGRLRTEEGDEDGELTDVVEAQQIIWGSEAEWLDKANGWRRIFDSDRGISMILPCDNENSVNSRARVKLKTRNYIGYNDLNQAGYVDSRFVQFVWGGDQ